MNAFKRESNFLKYLLKITNKDQNVSHYFNWFTSIWNSRMLFDSPIILLTQTDHFHAIYFNKFYITKGGTGKYINILL